MVFLGCFLWSGCTTHNAAMTFQAKTPEIEKTGLDNFKSIVVYDSWSGNTRLIAEEMADVLNCPAIAVDDVHECVISDYDLIVVGSPVHGGMPTNKIGDFLAGLESVKASAVFVTYGAPLFGSFTADRCLNSMEKKIGNTCLGRFKCNGFHEILRTYPSHPDEEDKSEAALFAVGLLERILTDDLREDEVQQ
jgi:flavodoxin